MPAPRAPVRARAEEGRHPCASRWLDCSSPGDWAFAGMTSVIAPYACAASPASVSAALSADPFIPETEEAMTEIARFLMRRLAA